MTKLNIIYIHSHDTGRYIQPYGYPVSTPNLQKLAEEGVLFRQNFCINPTCSASRSALVTGCYPHQNGMIGLANLGFKMYDYSKHINYTLKQNGYTTILTGIQHILEDDKNEKMKAWQKIGCDKCLDKEIVLDPEKYNDWTDTELSIKKATLLNNQVHENAVNFLKETTNEPFFMSVGFFDTHREFPTEEELTENPNYCMPPSPLPDTPEIRLDMARFKTVAKRLDKAMGAVFDAVKNSKKLINNTLIICTTDHGLAFPRMKCNLQDSGTGTMLIIKGPDEFEGGKVINSMTTHMDIYPTICELIGIDKPEWLEGKSLLPLVSGKENKIHDEVFSEINYHVTYEPIRSIRTERWKYIKRFDNRNKPVLPNCDDSESKAYLLKNGFKEHIIDEEMLFDLIYDPNEVNNLAYNDSFSNVLNELRSKLNSWMIRTNDPLLNGKVEPQKGTRINTPDAISNIYSPLK